MPQQMDVMESLYPGRDDYHSRLELLGDFIEKEIRPEAGRIDREEIFPRRSLERVAEKGIFSLPLPEEYGGEDMPYPLYVSALEMLAKACANTALPISIHGMICEGIRLFGSGLQKEEFLNEKGLARGRALIAFALTEPCCGSDARAIQTRAIRSGEKYVLTGSKTLISNPGEADFAIVFARAEKGISAFLVSSATSGFNVMKTISKLGFRGNQLAAIRIENCEVPKENLLGEEGRGLEYAKHILNCGRITIAAIGVGIAQAAFDKAVSYSKKRKAFGQSISDFELVQGKLADMATGIKAARLMTYYAASLKEKGKDIAAAAAEAKLFSSETAIGVCDKALQIHGGYGYIDASDIHRHLRDARMLTIGEGTSDMLRLFIAHMALKQG